MASGSASTTLTSGVGGKYTLSVSWSETGTSVTNNTSTISVTATMTRVTGYFNVTNAGTLKAYWHDNHTNSDVEVASLSFNELGSGTNSRSASGSVTRTHNSDGKLSGYAFARWTQLSATGGYVPPSGQAVTAWAELTQLASPPTGLTLSNIIPHQDGFTATVSVTGWGENGTEAGRYLELSVSSANGSVSNRRFQKHYGSDLSWDITVDNSSEEGNITIRPNTTYYLTMYASNGAAGTGNTAFTTVKTLAPFYVNNNGRTKAPNKVYINNGGRTKNPIKIYAVSNGRTKRIY